ncbi:YifB family Mg chelatase-like AAA ATPase [Acaricomes phytoseiuli]|uniref:YifB family Mg chelatase-like AAA ATPase n=1 Tax=Acaricomes phytoseiuli TaxID=291968 RepID=UPI0003A77A1D|nr:YifB family Mg chelatase-like AAA ATPase [Acaricomes phytoseiuli]
MSLGRTYAVALMGLRGNIVEIEADIGQTLPSFQILGLPDASLQEARERIRAAAHNAGVPLSRRKITVNLLPASLPKRGSSFDLAIVMAALRAAGDIQDPGKCVFLAELGLDGRLRPVRGVLPAVAAAVRLGFRRVVVASANLAEAQLVPGSEVIGCAGLGDVARGFGADPEGLVVDQEPFSPTAPGTDPTKGILPDLSEVAGQDEARIALEVAAAGRHHLLLKGPPGAGKTMLAERLPGILPDLEEQEAMEVTSVHSLSGPEQGCAGLIRRPPYENPHHTASSAAIIGGGSGIPRPGAASRAHRGVLFLDEAPEYERRVLDGLRQPLESGELVIHRSAGVASFPARFQLVLAANPCPCGQATGKGRDCTCTALARRRYFSKLSGPLLDRVDVQIAVGRLSPAQLSSQEQGEPSAAVAQRVLSARERARCRWREHALTVNAEIPGRLLRGQFRLSESVTRSLDTALERGVITARGYDRVLRIAWTLADLAQQNRPGSDELGQALMLRQHGELS